MNPTLKKFAQWIDEMEFVLPHHKFQLLFSPVITKTGKPKTNYTFLGEDFNGYVLLTPTLPIEFAQHLTGILTPKCKGDDVKYKIKYGELPTLFKNFLDIYNRKQKINNLLQ